MVFKGQDAWRSGPEFTGLMRKPFPGLKTAVIIFGVYCAAEFAYDTLFAGKCALISINV